MDGWWLYEGETILTRVMTANVNMQNLMNDIEKKTLHCNLLFEHEKETLATTSKYIYALKLFSAIPILAAKWEAADDHG